MKLSIFISDLSKILPRDSSTTVFIEDCKRVKHDQRHLFLNLVKLGADFEEAIIAISILEELTFNTKYSYEDFEMQYEYLYYIIEKIKYKENKEELNLPDFMTKEPIYYQSINGEKRFI